MTVSPSHSTPGDRLAGMTDAQAERMGPGPVEEPVKGPGGHVPAAHAGLPLPSRAIFWKPRHACASPVLAHLPFLFWVMEAVRPDTVVQIGLGDGVGFMALCQAIDKLGLEAMCMGIDCLPDSAPRQDMLLADHACLYSDFSFIVTDPPDRAPRHLENASVDLLVIDACLDDALLEQLRTRWEPLLSARAVVMLHDPRTNAAAPGAQAYLDMLRHEHPSIAFPQAARGLDVVLRGPDQPDRMVRFAGLEPGMAGYLTTRQVFMRLGEALEQDQQSGLQSGALRQARETLAAVQDELADTIAQLARRDGALADMAAHIEQAQAAAAASQALLERRQSELESLTAISEEARARARQLSEERDASAALARDAIAREDATRRTHDARIRQLAGVQAARDAALAEMADQLHTARTTAAQLEAGQDRLTAELTRLTRRLMDKQAECDRLRSQLADRHAEIEALRNSTSWKVTRPLRKLRQSIA